MKRKRSGITKICHLLLLIYVCVATSACQPALIYGERTSLQIASINLNDDVSEPVKVKVGFSRTLSSVAPPRGGENQEESIKVRDKEGNTGESVSVFSRFKMRNEGMGNFLGLGDTLRITTNFASGQAAINISNDAKAVGAILGMRTVGRDTPEIRKLRDRLIGCVKQLDVSKDGDRNKLVALAKNLATSISEDNPESTRSGVISYIDSASPDDLSILANATELGFCS